MLRWFTTHYKPHHPHFHQMVTSWWSFPLSVTNTDKIVIQQYQEKARTNCLRRTFYYWKKTSEHFQEATRLCKTSLTRRWVTSFIYETVVGCHPFLPRGLTPRTFAHEYIAASRSFNILINRCLGQWRNVACYRADLKKTLNTFRNSHILAKVSVCNNYNDYSNVLNVFSL